MNDEEILDLSPAGVRKLLHTASLLHISELHFARVALEFQSLAWFAKENAVNKQPGPATMTCEEFEALPEGSYCFQIPEAWAGVKDFYAAGQLRMDEV
ncbi:hypothetical protein GTP23_21555 [Pseudoduganella sp. FT93W]|uniref:Uncharacterized protein n=1 Tax=Duganella fentianensis TaxID=2692177 RepID=A0A845I366_9BURK|nr:hypothetical protein [Duganella fentianensis]MYN47632.1 hypothetical protein [Duganella fentianensis]